MHQDAPPAARSGSTNQLQRQEALTHQETMARLPLFSGVAPAQLAELCARSRPQYLPRSASLVHRGQRMPGFCVLAAGELKLSVVLPERGERVLGLVTAPSSFAEALALRRHPSSYDIVAMSESLVLVLRLSGIEALAAGLPRFARNLTELLADRTLEAQAELEASVLQRAPQRLANYLCSLAAHSGESATLPVSKTLLAAILGIKKETLSRLLRELAERGLIQVSNRRVTLLDREKLGEVT
jgi:CRP/FNR family transcriptional regulator